LGPLLRKPLQQSSALACFDVEDNRPQVADKIPEAKSALEGERKHITVLFAGPAGLISPCGWVFGYEPLRKGRHEQLEELRTGDSRPLPVHLMAQIVRELGTTHLLGKGGVIGADHLAQILGVEPGGHRCRADYETGVALVVTT
jgi:hypothetical protein